MHSSPLLVINPPQLADFYIKEKVTCIRAHRERICAVYKEQSAEKIIFHNYGQGGAGWTFLFGCVEKSIAQFHTYATQNPCAVRKPLCIIGAGCYGLLTAIMLTRLGYSVYIVAKELENLPSHKAAGFFFPRPRKSSNPHERATFLEFGTASYRAYTHIAHGTHPFLQNGASLLPAYYGMDIDPGFDPYSAQHLMPSPENVVIDFGNGKRYKAHAYSTVWINAPALMQELHKNIRMLGIPIHQAEIATFQDIPELIIFNCSGLGAKKLTHDQRIIPVQGHLITLKNQPSPCSYLLNFKVLQATPKGTMRDELIYFAPREEGILGITFLRGQELETAHVHEFERLLERCRAFFGT